MTDLLAPNCAFPFRDVLVLHHHLFPSREISPKILIVFERRVVCSVDSLLVRSTRSAIIASPCVLLSNVVVLSIGISAVCVVHKYPQVSSFFAIIVFILVAAPFSSCLYSLLSLLNIRNDLGLVSQYAGYYSPLPDAASHLQCD